MNGSTGVKVTALLVLMCLGAAGCSAPATPRSGPRGGSLAAVEVDAYKGEKLGSIADFRENSIKGPQHVDIGTYRLAVGGKVAEPATYTYDAILSKETTYTKVVTLNCVEGWSVKVLWEGVLLSDLIDRAKPDPKAVTVVFRAYDGYTTSLPLDYIRSNRILLAYKMNGVVMPDERGFPFQVVAQDRWGYKWAKWVTSIELSDDPKYKGYWEQRGYSQRGLQKNGPFEP
ncbi:MAG: molybdopterin-dependent oxidoreductase [Coriobacteriia bacterium]|nr:molybdopterin-dependent oxidoreductase [Coriobacteriia bacterium]